MVGCRADEVGSPDPVERVSDRGPVGGVMVSQEGFVDLANLQAFGDMDLLLRRSEGAERVDTAVVHRGRRGHWGGQKGLDLICLEIILLEPERELEHVLDPSAWVCRDKIGDQVLLLPRFSGVLIEELLKAIIRPHTRLHHLRERSLRERFRGDLEVASRVMLNELAHVLRSLDSEVVAHSRSDEYLLDSLDGSGLTIQAYERGLIRVEVGTNPWENTGWAATG